MERSEVLSVSRKPRPLLVVYTTYGVGEGLASARSAVIGWWREHRGADFVRLSPQHLRGFACHSAQVYGNRGPLAFSTTGRHVSTSLLKQSIYWRA